jgi:hypothetical protein
MQANQGAAANRRPAGQSDGSDNLSAIVAADRVFPAAVAELDRSAEAALRIRVKSIHLYICLASA